MGSTQGRPRAKVQPQAREDDPCCARIASSFRSRIGSGACRSTVVIDIFETLRLYSGCSQFVFSRAAADDGCPLALVGQTIADCSTPALIFRVSGLSTLAASLSISKSPVAQRLAGKTVDPREFRFADPSPDALSGLRCSFGECHTPAEYAG